MAMVRLRTIDEAKGPEQPLSSSHNNSMYDLIKCKLHSFKQFMEFLLFKTDDSLTKESNPTDNASEIRRQLWKYQSLLEDLALTNSPKMFSNGGKHHASILMSVLFKYTKNEARVYAFGFRPELITTEPYWSALNEYLNRSGSVLKVLVQTNQYIDGAPLKLLKEIKRHRQKNNIEGTICVKMISEDRKRHISTKFGDEMCNFAIFDKDKFRYEYDPVNFKAYGSFNQPDNCEILIQEFEEAFNDIKSTTLI